MGFDEVAFADDGLNVVLKNLEEESFCLRENVAKVYDCGKYVRVDSRLLGGGASYYSENMSEFSCPVVGPDYISQECKDIQGLNCKQINC